MKVHDIVCIMVGKMPVVGEVIAHTPKRIRIVVKIGKHYRYLLRAKTTVKFIQKGKRFL